MPSAVEALSRRSTIFASSSSSPAQPSMSKGKAEVGDCSASDVDSAFRNIIEEGG